MAWASASVKRCRNSISSLFMFRTQAWYGITRFISIKYYEFIYFLIHFSSFCRGLQANEWARTLSIIMFMFALERRFFLRSEFLFGCMLSSLSICFHYGSYPAFNWLFYASFCSMSLLDVICYDFCARELANRPKAPNNAYFSYLAAASDDDDDDEKEYIASEVEVKLNQRRLTTTNVHDKRPPSKTKRKT